MGNILEYHFNPKQTAVYDTACFLPKTNREKQAGILYLIAETEKDISSIAEEFYLNGFQSCLDKANELGINNLGVLAFSFPYKIKAALTGKIKILLLRGTEAFDISEGLEKQGLLKFIEGNLQKKDKLLFLTNEAFNVFQKYKIFSKIAPKSKKETKAFFKENKAFFQAMHGALIIAFVKKAPWPLFIRKPKNPLPPASKIEKGVIALIVLLIVLLLGWLLF